MTDDDAGPAPGQEALADAHIHLFRHGFRGPEDPVGGVTDELAAYQQLRTRHGIARALVIGFEGASRHHGNNDYLAELAVTEPWIAPVAYLPVWPPLDHVAVERLAEDGFVGVSCWVQSAEDADRVDAWPAGLCQAIGRLFRVVSLNARGDVIARLAGAVEALAPAHVLFSHLGLPGRHDGVPGRAEARERLAGLLALAPQQHVGVKASGVYALSAEATDPYPVATPYLGEIVDTFGVDRVYWGSDFVPVLARMPFDRAVTIPLPVGGEERRLIMGGNLLRLLAR